MITTDIVNEVAHILRQKAAQKDGQELKIEKANKTPHDEVELTPAASEYAAATAHGDGLEKEQRMKVERLKALVASGNYKMDEDMVTNIASRIAKMFIQE